MAARVLKGEGWSDSHNSPFILGERSLRFPLSRRLGGSQRLSGRGGEVNFLVSTMR